MAMKDVEKILYFENFVVMEPGLQSLKKVKFCLTEDHDSFEMNMV